MGLLVDGLHPPGDGVRLDEVTVVRVIVGMDGQGGVGAGTIMGGGEGGEVEFHQDVGIEDQQVPGGWGLDGAQTARRAQGRGFLGIADAQSPASAVANKIPDLTAKMADADDDVIETMAFEQTQGIVEQGASGHRGERLGEIGRQRTQACALAAGNDDCLQVHEAPKGFWRMRWIANRTEASESRGAVQPRRTSLAVSYWKRGTSPTQPRSPPV